jgi:hypothetical protein
MSTARLFKVTDFETTHKQSNLENSGFANMVYLLYISSSLSVWAVESRSAFGPKT